MRTSCCPDQLSRDTTYIYMYICIHPPKKICQSIVALLSRPDRQSGLGLLPKIIPSHSSEMYTLHHVIEDRACVSFAQYGPSEKEKKKRLIFSPGWEEAWLIPSTSQQNPCFEQAIGVSRCSRFFASAFTISTLMRHANSLCGYSVTSFSLRLTLAMKLW